MTDQSAPFPFMARHQPRARPRSHVEVAGDGREASASLIDLIGRTAWFAAALLVGAALACAFGNAAFSAATVAWLALIAAAALALIGATIRAHRAPARRASIVAYIRGFSGTLVYAGTVWGAGGFLASLDGNLLVLLASSTGAVLTAVALLRERMPVLCFSIPALVVATVSAWADIGLMAGLLVGTAGACILGAAEIAARLSEQPRDPTLTLS